MVHFYWPTLTSEIGLPVPSVGKFNTEKFAVDCDTSDLLNHVINKSVIYLRVRTALRCHESTATRYWKRRCQTVREINPVG